MKKLLALGLSVLAGFVLIPAASALATPSTTVVISEVQTRGPGGASDEFVELFNASDTPVDVTGWRVMYVPANGGTATTRATLSGSIQGRSFVLAGTVTYMPGADFAFSSALADAGGHVFVLDASNAEIDRVGWGTATQPETVAAAAPSAGQSLRREADPSNLFTDTDNNVADFVAGIPDPQSGLLAAEPEPEPEPEPEAPPMLPCEGVILSEIGTNFVELYNPTLEALPLESCQLSFGDISHGFDPGSTLAADGYVATEFAADLSAQGMIALITASGATQVPYPVLAYGQAWILFDGVWQLTLQPTPGGANMLVQQAEEPEEDPAPEPQPQTPEPKHSCRHPHIGRMQPRHPTRPTVLPKKHQSKLCFFCFLQSPAAYGLQKPKFWQ